MEAADVGATRTLTAQFCEYAANTTSWSFDFTDEIGDAAERLFSQSRDEEIRGTLVEMTFDLGIGYNRFYVMRRLGNMLSKVQQHHEIAYLAQRFGKRSASDRERVRYSFGDDVQLPPALSRLFPRK